MITSHIWISRKQNVNAVHIAKVEGSRLPGITDRAYDEEEVIIIVTSSNQG